MSRCIRKAKVSPPVLDDDKDHMALSECIKGLNITQNDLGVYLNGYESVDDQHGWRQGGG
jgi:hypothetical protein